MFRLQGASKDQRIAARYIPKNSAKVALKDGSAVVYLYGLNGKVYAIGYQGTSSRSAFHYAYSNEARRREAVERFFAAIRSSNERKAQARAAKSAWTNPLQAGDVLYTSWGYDQTNIDFYVVTRVSGRRTWIAPIASELKETGFMSGKCWAAKPVRITGDETVHIAQPSGERGAYVKVGHNHAWLDDGREHGCSWYA